MSPTPEEKLIKEGWQKQAIYDDPRLSEMVEMYAEIGFEAHLEPFNAADESGCSSCMQKMPDLFKTISLRGKTDQAVTKDE